MSWAEGMARAYAAGVADGKIGYQDPTHGGGFDACYWQGWGHGAQRCECPEKLVGNRDWRSVCTVCGIRRTTTETKQ